MRLLVTGASGFLGKYVIAEALRRNHQVKAIVRPRSDTTSLPWHDHPNLEFVRLDLRQQRGIVEALENVDVVLHLAATKGGDFYTQFAGTVLATENLLAAMAEVNLLRLVHISTFSVYDYLNMPPGKLLDEDSPIEVDPVYRDEYAQTKLIQEQLVREFEQKHGAKVTILRPGMIYGRECLWHAFIGAEFAESFWLRIGSSAIMPLTYVENCANAIVVAAERDEANAQTLNIIDDDLPTQNAYVKKLVQRTPSPPRLVLVPWMAMKLFSDALWFYNQRFVGGRMKFPSILVPARMQARFKPLRYSNRRAKQVLNWTPQYSLDEALDRSCSEVELLSFPSLTPLSPS
ncbi:NAD(P)-dependent oxidoreductase [Candidatus Gracilibacteria bacterium]|nr:NAD(P)-dependent oxidoreductase [Candidatus Gracilibacteria bacterium]NJM90045.1 NAD(P)-dependent oxidoreductase [Hydrococcus sp. RU_2_2]NJP21715.1 NAD(P)-dependent oxidoreductase [Hydrococcus sp. CRU_1_1]